jgi:hypothetical protein
MAEINLTQEEANVLIAMEKHVPTRIAPIFRWADNR